MANPLFADLAARLGRTADAPLPTDARERMRRRLYHAADEMFRAAEGSGNVDLLARAMAAGKVVMDVLPPEEKTAAAGGVVVQVIEHDADGDGSTEPPANGGA